MPSIIEILFLRIKSHFVIDDRTWYTGDVLTSLSSLHTFMVEDIKKIHTETIQQFRHHKTTSANKILFVLKTYFSNEEWLLASLHYASLFDRHALFIQNETFGDYELDSIVSNTIEYFFYCLLYNMITLSYFRNDSSITKNVYIEAIENNLFYSKFIRDKKFVIVKKGNCPITLKQYVITSHASQILNCFIKMIETQY